MSEETKQTGITFHMVPREYFEAQPIEEGYQPEPMRSGRENFIHTTEGNQNVADTGNRFYTGDPREFIILVIEKGLVTAPVIYEDPNKIFPHIYGPLNREAIVGVKAFPRDLDGKFLVPD